MVRIGVLSDTHFTETSEAIPFLQGLVTRYFPAVDIFLHAGDIIDFGVLAAFAPSPVYGVRGNMDPATPDLPDKRVLHIEGLRIGLIHGWGNREGLVARIRGEFGPSLPDCLIFGHSHVPMCRLEGGVLLFNPGSATDRREMPYASVGLLEVENGRITGHIIPLNE